MEAAGGMTVLSNLAVESPLVLVWLVGIVLAFVYWRRNRAVSLLALVGFVLQLVIVVSALVKTWMTLAWVGQMPFTMLTAFTTVWGVVNSLLGAVAWGLIIAAIFGWRKAQAVSPVPSSTPS